LKRETVRASDLVKVTFVAPVVLNSGGDVMELVCIEGDNAIVEWENQSREKKQRLIPVACLSRLVPLEKP
jgi:hypothetical protein